MTGYDAEQTHIPEHRRHIRAELVCVGDWAILRAVDADGAWRLRGVVVNMAGKWYNMLHRNRKGCKCWE